MTDQRDIELEDLGIDISITNINQNRK